MTQKWTPSVRSQLNDLPGFPARPNTVPPADDRWELGEWIDETRVRPGVATFAALPVTGNELGDVRVVDFDQSWYYWNALAWIAVNALPFGPAGGDLSGNYPNPTVSGIQGRPVPDLAPSQGQVIQWNGTEWVPGTIPSGGSGGGGVTYFLNENTAPDAPTTGLAVNTKEQGVVADALQTTSTTTNVSTGGVFDEVAAFVTDLSTPGSTAIPAGLWDFNIWATTTAAGVKKCSIRTKLYKYDGTTATLISTAETVLLFNGTVLTQYTVTLVVPPTPMLVTDRIYTTVEATAVGANVDITLYFGDITPSHVLSTVQAVQGTGVLHIINGVLQSPATPVSLTADVSGVLPVANGGTNLSTTPTNGQILIGDGTGYALATISAGTGISVTNGVGTIDVANTGVTSVGVTAPIASSGGATPTISLNDSGVLAASYGTASSVPTLAVTAKGLISSASDTPIAISGSQVTSGVISVANGGTGLSSTPSDGQLLIGNGTAFTEATLTAGTGISIANGSGSITITNTGVSSFSGGTTGLTPAAPTTGAITLGGTLNVSNGGTGLTSAGGVANRAVYTADGTSFTVGQLPNAALANSSLTVSASTGLTGGGLVSLGGSTSLSIANTAVVAASYGSASAVATFTANAQGQLTTAATTPIAIDASQITSGTLTLPINPLKLGTGAVQSITAPLNQITPTGSYHRITNTTGGNITLSTAQASINWPGAVAGQVLIVQMVVVPTVKNVVLSRSSTTRLALDGSTVNLTPGASVVFVFDGTLWVQLSFINGTSAP